MFYSIVDILNYTLEDLDKFLSQFPTDPSLYLTLGEKRYMTAYYLHEHNLVDPNDMIYIQNPSFQQEILKDDFNFENFKKTLDFANLPLEVLKYILLKLKRKDLLYYCSQNIPNIRNICNNQSFRVEYNTLHPLITAVELNKKVQTIRNNIEDDVTHDEYMKNIKKAENEIDNFIKNNDFTKTVLIDYIIFNYMDNDLRLDLSTYDIAKLLINQGYNLRNNTNDLYNFLFENNKNIKDVGYMSNKKITVMIYLLSEYTERELINLNILGIEFIYNFLFDKYETVKRIMKSPDFNPDKIITIGENTLPSCLAIFYKCNNNDIRRDILDIKINYIDSVEYRYKISSYLSNKNYSYFLYIAIQSNDIDILNKILKLGVKYNPDDVDLKELFVTNFDMAKKIVLNYNLNLNIQDQNGDTYLHYLAENSYRNNYKDNILSSIKLLLLFKTDKKLLNDKGLTAYDIAKNKYGIDEILILLNPNT